MKLITKFILVLATILVSLITYSIEENLKAQPLKLPIESINNYIGELSFDVATSKVKLTQTSNTIPATPCELNPPDIPCPPNTLYSTSCRPRCANIAQGG